ncbi:MAG: hypothetical protein DI551_01230 [Micavibrio aeruginosavorus]|uniref:HNH endonuclease n=1 Tax=Micavibrio aeruginosavorus TaxID=349221 RepID=A0A2W5N543_9BACT|nr:MAG: hypothetical protein DI551_01230 [Micavibrio aeruginosavorus]
MLIDPIARIKTLRHEVEDILLEQIGGLKWALYAASAEDHIKLWEKKRILERQLTFFGKVCTNLPPSLELFTFERQPRSAKDRQQLKVEFSRRVQRPFLIEVFQDKASLKTLERMNLNDHHFAEFFRNDTNLPNNSGQLLDLSVDHIVDRWLGGDNTAPNLCVVPFYLNSLKDRFVMLQVMNNQTDIISFRPRMDGQGNRVIVPYIPNGFRPPTRDILKLTHELLDHDGPCP